MEGAHGEILAMDEQAHDPRYVALRYFNAATGDPKGELGEAHNPETHLIPRVLRVLEVASGTKPFIHIYGSDYDTADGTCIRNYIHLTHLAQAHILALKGLLDAAPSRAYNLRNQRGFSVKEVVEAARKVTERPIPIKEFPRRPGDPSVLIAS